MGGGAKESPPQAVGVRPVIPQLDNRLLRRQPPGGAAQIQIRKGLDQIQNHAGVIAELYRLRPGNHRRLVNQMADARQSVQKLGGGIVGTLLPLRVQLPHPPPAGQQNGFPPVPGPPGIDHAARPVLHLPVPRRPHIKAVKQPENRIGRRFRFLYHPAPRQLLNRKSLAPLRRFRGAGNPLGLGHAAQVLAITGLNAKPDVGAHIQQFIKPLRRRLVEGRRSGQQPLDKLRRAAKILRELRRRLLPNLQIRF